MNRADLLDGFHVQPAPHDAPTTHADDDDAPHVERFAVDLRAVPPPLRPFSLAILARSDELRLEVGNLPE